MPSDNRPVVVCMTILVESSPQALPLGAACVASALKSDPRTRDRLELHLEAFSLEQHECPESIAKNIVDSVSHLDCLCLSVYVWNHVLCDQVAAAVKALSPDTLFVAGGPEVTADPLAFSSFDYTVAGEGEYSIPALLERLLLDKKIDSFYGDPKGLCYDIQGIYSPPLIPGQKSLKSETVLRSRPCGMEELPSPYLDGTIDARVYGGVLWELARGCPFKCSYCYESKGEKRVRYFPMERLEKEIELFASQGISQAFVLDPTYNADRKRAVAILDILRRKAPGMFFYFEARAEFIDREMARAFASIPCCLQIGLQSSSEAVLSKVHRTFNKNLFVKNVGILNQEGAVFGFDLIYGLPGDTLKGFKESIDFAVGLYPNNLELFCLSVLPGTSLYDEAESLGLKWESSPPYHVTGTSGFTARDLERAESLSRAVNIFYSEGRAVPWFNSVLHLLKEKASAFFQDFADYLAVKKLDRGPVPDSIKIEALQHEFLSSRLKQRGLGNMIPLVSDIVALNSAMGRCTADGSSSVVALHYHPDDLMSGYASDLRFFFKNAGRCTCRAKVFPTASGPDWRRL